MPARRLYLRIALFTVIVLALAGPATAQTDDYGPVGQAQHRDVLIASDMWSKTPGIMGISLNFADIIAAPDLDSSAKANQSYADARAAVLKAGGAWNDNVTCVAHRKWRTKPWAFTTTIGFASREATAATACAPVQQRPAHRPSACVRPLGKHADLAGRRA